jgi:uridine kinase
MHKFLVFTFIITFIKVSLFSLIGISENFSDISEFIKLSSFQLFGDPWYVWLESNGDFDAFPYGFFYYSILKTLSYISSITHIPFNYMLLFLFGITEIAIFVLLKLKNKVSDRTLYIFMFSPLGIISSYVFILNDILIALLVYIAFESIKSNHLIRSGIVWGLVLGIKLNAIVLLPVTMFYVLRRGYTYYSLLNMLLAGLCSYVLADMPSFYSWSKWLMIINNQEAQNLLKLGIQIDENTVLSFAFVAYISILFFLWRVKRLNADLATGALVVTTLSLSSFSASAPIWLVWTLPYLVMYYDSSATRTRLLIFVSTTAFGMHSLLSNWPVPILIEAQLLGTISHSFCFGSAVILTVKLMEDYFFKSQHFRYFGAPKLIAIAGDSGSGKDTTVDGLEDVLGIGNVLRVSGDDYHRWDRRQAHWRYATHLNPSSNALAEIEVNLKSLINANKIITKIYDHTVGIYSLKDRIKEPKSFVIYSGLHALFSEEVRKISNLKIFLDMDEDLRRALKLERDVKVRGHLKSKVLASLEKRQEDKQKYIIPQMQHADLVIKVAPTRSIIDSNLPRDYDQDLQLEVTFKSFFDARELRRILVGQFGIECDLANNSSGATNIVISGNLARDDIEFISHQLFHDIADVLTSNAVWHSGVKGLIQILILLEIQRQYNRC